MDVNIFPLSSGPITTQHRKILRYFTEYYPAILPLHQLCEEKYGYKRMAGRPTKGSIFVEKDDDKKVTERKYEAYVICGGRKFKDPEYFFEICYDIKQEIPFSKGDEEFLNRSFILSPGAVEYGYYEIPIKFTEIADKRRKQDLCDRVLGEYNIDLPQEIVNMIMDFNLYKGHYKLILQSYIPRALWYHTMFDSPLSKKTMENWYTKSESDEETEEDNKSLDELNEHERENGEDNKSLDELDEQIKQQENDENNLEELKENKIKRALFGKSMDNE